MTSARAAVGERTAEISGLPILWREAEPRATPVLYLHGNPTDGADFAPMLERTGGLAPDLPGFGRSAKPSGFDYSIDGYADFLEAFLDVFGLERISLVVHDWGGVGLAFAQRRPHAIERLVISNCVPLLPGYRWHRVARLWRTRVVGELTMGFTTKLGLRHGMLGAFTTRGPSVDEVVDRAWSHFDHGTQRAALRLYRSAPTEVLERAGARLGELTAPALIAWGARDPFISTDFAHAYAQALGGEARVRMAEDAGHWPWIDRPALAEEITRFLLAE